ncbi:motility protein A [Vallicoccus soli]|uniref:Motility protein A n=1 Tax=Vallicoccus soli TaxID=2339232 RepID=A0A3A3YN43_9ACTN|nr:motility protein A [Vallicoccus soli]RJK92809.1 motility protein A [Vallicoccus soli]
MDPATIGGLVLAFAAISLGAILEGASPTAMFLLPPIILIFGGTFGATMAGSTLKDFLGALKMIPVAFTAKVPPADGIVDTVVSLAERARREGLLALEDASKSVEDPFLKRGLELAIDGTDPDELAEIMEARIRAKKAADKVSYKLFTDMGGYAPTIGIVGTVLSLTHVLGMLDQPELLGPSIAVALLATLWGVLSANVIWLPISKRLERLSNLQAAQMELALEGILAIQAGSNPRVVGQKLRALLPPADADAAEAKAA